MRSSTSSSAEAVAGDEDDVRSGRRERLRRRRADAAARAGDEREACPQTAFESLMDAASSGLAARDQSTADRGAVPCR